MPIRFAGLCPRDLLMLVTRYHGVWIIIVPAFTETSVIADVIVTFARSSTMSPAWTTAVTTTLRPARSPSGRALPGVPVPLRPLAVQDDPGCAMFVWRHPLCAGGAFESPPDDGIPGDNAAEGGIPAPAMVPNVDGTLSRPARLGPYSSGDHAKPLPLMDTWAAVSATVQSVPSAGRSMSSASCSSAVNRPAAALIAAQAAKVAFLQHNSKKHAIA